MLVGTDFGDGSLTDSGYPRLVKRWRRGQPLADAELLFSGHATSTSASGRPSTAPRVTSGRWCAGLSTSSTEQVYELRRGEFIRIDAPTDATLSIHREWLLIELRSDWFTATRASTGPARCWRPTMTNSSPAQRNCSVVFEPDEHTCLHHYAWTRDRLVVVTLADVASRVEVVTPGDWRAEPVTGLPEDTNTVIVAADHAGDEVFLDSSGFDRPSRLLRGTAGGELERDQVGAAVLRRRRPHGRTAFRDSPRTARQIPYFVVGHTRDQPVPAPRCWAATADSRSSRTPGYDGVLGRLWLARGGTYVLANIRGGGEYGPTWHTQAMREGRHKVAEDFAAVAQDLVDRGITTVAQLGAAGGSNGGLLMGIMLTQYPELFGALVCSVPLLDMRRFHLLLAGASWVAEYGNPDDPADWEFIEKYSPYHHISADRHYPPLLITTSTRDDRVHPGHARKMTAALQAAGHHVRYYENIEGGHAGAADNKQAAFKSALMFEFLWRTVGSACKRTDHRDDDADNHQRAARRQRQVQPVVQAAFGVADHHVTDGADVVGGLVQRVVDVTATDLDRRPAAAAHKQCRNTQRSKGFARAFATATVSNAATAANTAAPMLTHGPQVAKGRSSPGRRVCTVPDVSGTLTLDGSGTRRAFSV